MGCLVGCGGEWGFGGCVGGCCWWQCVCLVWVDLPVLDCWEDSGLAGSWEAMLGSIGCVY